MARRSCTTFQALVWCLVFIIPSVALGLTEEEIQGAIEKGLSAEKLRDVPAFIRLGVREDRGLNRLQRRGYAHQNYVYLARSCAHWISNLAFLQRETVDREAIDGKCLGRDWLQVVVAAEESGDPLEHYDPGSYFSPDLPINALSLRGGGEKLQPDSIDFERYGKGNVSALFDLAQASKIRPLWVVARVAWEKDFKIQVIPQVRRKLFSKKLRQTGSGEDEP